jgi:cell division septation protein DedD
MAKAHAVPSRKLRVSIPAADVSVLQWLDAQASLADSLRVLIRESIQRDGYIDVAFKPVEQLPRRGRPPADIEQAQAEGETQSAPAARGTVATPPATHSLTTQPAASTAAQPKPSATPPNDPGAEDDAEDSVGVALSNGAGSAGQFDMDDIFGHGS